MSSSSEIKSKHHCRNCKSRAYESPFYLVTRLNSGCIIIIDKDLIAVQLYQECVSIPVEFVIGEVVDGATAMRNLGFVFNVKIISPFCKFAT